MSAPYHPNDPLARGERHPPAPRYNFAHDFYHDTLVPPLAGNSMPTTYEPPPFRPNIIPERRSEPYVSSTRERPITQPVNYEPTIGYPAPIYNTQQPTYLYEPQPHAPNSQTRPSYLSPPDMDDFGPRKVPSSLQSVRGSYSDVSGVPTARPTSYAPYRPIEEWRAPVRTEPYNTYSQPPPIRQETQQHHNMAQAPVRQSYHSTGGTGNQGNPARSQPLPQYPAQPLDSNTPKHPPAPVLGPPQPPLHVGPVTFADIKRIQLRRSQLETFLTNPVAPNLYGKLKGLLVRVNAGNQGQHGYVVVQVLEIIPNPGGRPQKLKVMHENGDTDIPISSVSDKELGEEEWARSRNTIKLTSRDLDVLFRNVETVLNPPLSVNINNSYHVNINYYQAPHGAGKTAPRPTTAKEAPVQKRTYLDVQKDENPDILGFEKRIVSLRCPLSLARMKLPVKGKNCTHAQCFDKTSFYMCSLQKKSATQIHKCPVCKSHIFGERDLIVDVELAKILKATEHLKGAVNSGGAGSEEDEEEVCMQVAIYADGRWEPVDEKGKLKRFKKEDGADESGGATESKTTEPPSKKKKVEVVVLDDD
eukprot:comp18136_c0_seq1/m.18866 comp18136_c0_seq1/g.18866  ORF comp18136_c0_seq1/g.18866 comp18136_c0_seq1/m.18866 type:complete len:587 (-) comp18136_c0_seq1:618-2378(-)